MNSLLPGNRSLERENIVTLEDRILKLDSMTRHVYQKDATALLIDGDPITRLSFGVPIIKLGDNSLNIDVPNTPYVFLVNELYVKDPEHPSYIKMNDVPVILAHGHREGSVWKFTDGQPVSNTVNSYNSYALRNDLPPIEFVIACNKDKSPNPANIKVKDLDPVNIAAQAVGETMRFGLGFDDLPSQDGYVIARVNTKGLFFGLDELIKHKSITQRIKIVNSS